MRFLDWFMDRAIPLFVILLLAFLMLVLAWLGAYVVTHWPTAAGC